MTKTTMTTSELDEYFDNGGDITEFIVPGSLHSPNRAATTRKININMPEWMIDELDLIAMRTSGTRQSVICMWLYERLLSDGNRMAEQVQNSRTLFEGDDPSPKAI